MRWARPSGGAETTGTAFRPHSPSHAVSHGTMFCLMQNHVHDTACGSRRNSLIHSPHQLGKGYSTLMLLSRTIRHGTVKIGWPRTAVGLHPGNHFCNDSSTRENARTFTQSQVYICQAPVTCRYHSKRLTQGTYPRFGAETFALEG